MKKFLQLFLSVVMTMTLANCSDDDGGGKGKGNAAAPDREGCLYDVDRGFYRYNNGDRCDHREFYDENACYNYYFRPHTDVTRFDDHYNREGYRHYDGYFTNSGGEVVNCNLQYIGQNNFFPYYFYHNQQGYVYGCQWWGNGLHRVPLGNGGYVCYYNSTTPYNIYQSPGWTYYNNSGIYYGSPGWYYDDQRTGREFLRDAAIGAAIAVGAGALVYSLGNGWN